MDNPYSLDMGIYSIRDLFKSVREISISAEVVYRSSFGEIKRNYTSKHTPDIICDFTFECPNKDCTIGEFDLYNIISNMVANKIAEKEGKLDCNGNEASDHNNKCPTSLYYVVKIGYNEK